MLRDQLRPVFQDLGEIRSERARDPPVQLGAALAQDRVVRGLLDQDVLEGVHCIRRLAAPKPAQPRLSWRKAPCSSVSGRPATAARSS